jgi:phosphotriesterase-related protein
MEAGLLGRVLVSQDAGWYHVGEAGGGSFRGYTDLLATFVPRLRALGTGDGVVEALLVQNPARAFAMRPRLL